MNDDGCDDESTVFFCVSDMCVRFNCVPTSNLNCSHWIYLESFSFAHLFTLAVAMVATMTVAAATATARAATVAECPAACCSLVASSCSFVAFVYLFCFFFYSPVFRLLIWCSLTFFSAVCSLSVRVPSLKAVTVLATANQHCLSSGISMWFWINVSPAVFCRHTDTHLNAFIHTHTHTLNTLVLVRALAWARSSFIVFACKILSQESCIAFPLI